MNIESVDPDDNRQVRDLLRLPFDLYRDTPQWVPPLESDARAPFNLKRFPFYQHSEAAFLLAHQDGSPVGRIVALNNRRYNQHNHKRAAHFYWFESRNDPRASGGLFAAAIEWARGQGLEEIAGPKGFTPLDGGGILIEVFEHRPAFGMPYNPPYYPDLIEAAGFEPAGETVSGYLSAEMQFPARIHELSERVQRRRGLTVARYRTRRDLRVMVPQLQKLYNDSLGGTEENSPLTDEEARSLANQLLWFTDPRLVKVVMKGDQPVGFLLAYPDVSAALQKTRGKLFPVGWYTLWRELRRTDWVNINGAGLTEEYRGSGGTAVLFSEIQRSIIQTGQFRHADAVQIGFENSRMLREMENFGISFYKRHRTYRRDL